MISTSHDNLSGEEPRISSDDRPRLRKGFRLAQDKARARWVIQAPERLFVLDEIAVEIIRCCDGVCCLGDIADRLAVRYNAPRDVVFADVVRLVNVFIGKGAMTL